MLWLFLENDELSIKRPYYNTDSAIDNSNIMVYNIGISRSAPFRVIFY
jgi:hypothetical protein